MKSPLFVRRFLFRLIRHRWQVVGVVSLVINCLLSIFILYQSHTNSYFDQLISDRSRVVSLPSFGHFDSFPGSANEIDPLYRLLTVVIIEFEQFEHDLEDTLGDLCTQMPHLNILLITDHPPYPPLHLSQHSNCHIRILNRQPDARRSLLDHRPEYQINTEYTMFIPDCTRISSQMLLARNLKLSHVRPNQIVAIPIMHLNEDIDFQYECLSVHFDYRRWTLRFEERVHEHHQCEALTGEFAFLMRSPDLLHMAMPFERPFPMSLYVQAKLHNLTIWVDEDLKFYKSRILFSQDERNRAKAEQLNSVRLNRLFRQLGVKKVIESNSEVHWFGCNKHTPRCFQSIHQDTPDYLYQGRWTPPCCLENLKLLAHHVFTILEQCQVRYWLEGGTLLGAVRSGDMIPWDYDLDVGIYREDIVKCPLLNLTMKSGPVKDDRNYLWERASEGDFLRVHFSPINRLHMDLFPFHSKNGIMTKNTWFADHVQDKEFPEHFLKPLEKIMFLGRQTYAPNNARDFLEYKFGVGVIENPQYPRPELLPFNVTKEGI